MLEIKITLTNLYHKYIISSQKFKQKSHYMVMVFNTTFNNMSDYIYIMTSQCVSLIIINKNAPRNGEDINL
jgi:hypothetical protein